MKYSSTILRIIKPLKAVFEFFCQYEALIASRWAASAHYRLMKIQWAIPPQPEHFDHHIDLFYNWQKTRNPQWTERGVFGALTLKGKKCLELACGDGFNTRNFYSLRSESIIACDYSLKAIHTARKKNFAPNIQYVLSDIRKTIPTGRFENVIWDAAIEHFTIDEIKSILREIKARLTEDGILSGHTIVIRDDGIKSLSHHEHEFSCKDDLLSFLAPYFTHSIVFETKYPDRHNLYFWASDGKLPFASGWESMVTSRYFSDEDRLQKTY